MVLFISRASSLSQPYCIIVTIPLWVPLMFCGHSKPELAILLSGQVKSQFRTAPREEGPRTYRHRGCLPDASSGLGRTGPVGAYTCQTWTGGEKTVFLSKRSKHLILCTVGGVTLRRTLFRLLQSNFKCIS